MSQTVRAQFADDHFIEALRGAHRLRPRQVRRILAMRCQYLETSITTRALAGKPISMNLEELAAIAQVMEAYEASLRAKEDDGEG